jgi:hypothetical protein
VVVVAAAAAAAAVVAAKTRKRCTMTFVLCMIQLWSQTVKLESWCVSSLAGQFFLLRPLFPLSIQFFDQSSPHKYCIPILPLLVTCKQNTILPQNSHLLISLDQLAFSLQHSSSPGSGSSCWRGNFPQLWYLEKAKEFQYKQSPAIFVLGLSGHKFFKLSWCEVGSVELVCGLSFWVWIA